MPGTREGVEAVRRPPGPLLGFVLTNDRSSNLNTEGYMHGVSKGPRSFLLSCNHIVVFRMPWPNIADTVTCLRCNANRTIKARFEEYRADCGQCDFHRTFGLDLLTAERRGAYHARMSGHAVTVSQGRTPLKIIPGSQNLVMEA